MEDTEADWRCHRKTEETKGIILLKYLKKMALWRTTQFRQGMVSFFTLGVKGESWFPLNSIPKLACCLHNSVHSFLQVSFFLCTSFALLSRILLLYYTFYNFLLCFLFPYCLLLFYSVRYCFSMANTSLFFFSSFYCPEHPLLISSLSMSLPEHTLLTSTLSFSPQGHFLTFPLSFVTSLLFLSTVSRLKEIPEMKPSPMPNVSWHNLQVSIKTGGQVIGFIGQRKWNGQIRNKSNIVKNSTFSISMLHL